MATSRWYRYEGVFKSDQVFRGPAFELVPRAARQRLLKRMPAVKSPRWVRWAAWWLMMTANLLFVMSVCWPETLPPWLFLVNAFGAFAMIPLSRKMRSSKPDAVRAWLRDELLQRPCFQCGHSLLGETGTHCDACGSPIDRPLLEKIEAELLRVPEPGAVPESDGAVFSPEVALNEL